MSDPSQRYPLSWPTGWTRTPPGRRRRANFATNRQQLVTLGPGQTTTRVNRRALTVSDALTRLSGELGRLGATDEILSTNVSVRLDGLPRSGQPEPNDPGAATYFKLKKKPLSLACDRWDRVADNIAAIAQHIDALRRIDRYGVGTMEQAFAGYAALPPTHEDWWLVLGLRQSATRGEIRESWAALSKKHHPDNGGDHDTMAKINRAYEVALAAAVAP